MFLAVRKTVFPFIIALVLTLFIILLPYSTLFASSEISKEKKLIYTNVVGLSAITLWGVVNWDYFETEMNKKNEGWFSENTKYGGSDKLGIFTRVIQPHVFFRMFFTTGGIQWKGGHFLGHCPPLP